MNKILSLLAIIILILTFSCDSAGSSSDSEDLSEAAGALAAAGAVMGAEDYYRSLGSPPYLTSPPFASAPADQEIPDGYGNIAIYSSSNNTINFNNFHVIYDDNQYILNGLIVDCTYSFASNSVTASFTGDVTIEGGNLTGSYTVDIDIELDLSYFEGIVVTGTATGTVNGESVDITFDETFPYVVMLPS